jgi:hypothetical protein
VEQQVLAVLLRQGDEPLAEHLRGERVGTEIVRREVEVLGWSCRKVGLPFGETTVPQMRTVAGERVTSTSHLRIASTSPIRADVPSMTSMIASS